MAHWLMEGLLRLTSLSSLPSSPPSEAAALVAEELRVFSFASQMSW